MSRFSILVILFFSVAVWGQIAVQPDYKLLNVIAACRTVKCMIATEPRAHGRVERTVLYAKWMLLDASDQNAPNGLLENLPATEEEFAAVMTLPDWHEQATESTSDMKALAAIYEEWPHLLATAVRRRPDFLSAYIRFGRVAISDPHSEYTISERDVCRADKKKFVAAFHTLSENEQRDIRKYVFDPDNCKPVFMGEGD